jgi:hypothetical protein
LQGKRGLSPYRLAKWLWIFGRHPLRVPAKVVIKKKLNTYAVLELT